MNDPVFDVCGIGSAIVDVIAREDDAFIERLGLRRGAAIVDEAHAVTVYEAIGTAVEMSGGSAANTVAGIASFGGRTAFLSRRHADQLGEVFAHDMRANGVVIPNEAVAEGDPTGRCIVVVTPDGERTMTTALGTNRHFASADLVDDVIAGSDITFVEGYLYDAPMAKAAIHEAFALAHLSGRRTALSLSDPFCVDRHRSDFRELVTQHVDILLANEHEICSLYEVDTFDEALQHVHQHTEIAALTRGAQGAVIVAADEVHVLDAEPVAQVLDTTGAGDQYAAGFLYGITHGFTPAESGRLGALAAAEVLQHLGARPERPLKELLPA